jgi:hypothetical protein
MVFGYFYLKAGTPRFQGLETMRREYEQWRIRRAKKKFQVYLRKHGSDRDISSRDVH